MVLLIGLGNPGIRYEGTRHNIGYMILDYYKSRSKNKFKYKYNDYYHSYTYGKVCLLKPMLYMNRSGQSLSHYLKVQKKDIDDVLVLHDDMDIEFGFIKYSENKGSGGHRGIESINEYIPDNKFIRCRIGIGRAPSHIDPADYVLENFSEKEGDVLELLLSRIAESIEVFIHHGYNKTANLFNRTNLILEK